VPLKRGEVVEQLWALLLLLLLELRDLARLPGGLLDDLRRLFLGDPLAAEVAARVEALLARGEAGLDQPVRLRLEGPDLLLALGDQREGRRLDPPERDGAVEGGPQADRSRPRGVHTDDPVGLRARAGRRLEPLHLLAGQQRAEGVLDRLLRHRVEPQPLDGLVAPGGVIDVREDQLALAAGVARVDDVVDLVALDQLVDSRQLLLGLVVVGDELELLGQDRQVREAPLLQLRVVRVGLREPDEVADRPGDHVVVPDQAGLVLGLLEGTRQRAGEVAGNRRFLGYDERLSHGGDYLKIAARQA
jgi:hypothetical protein